MELEGKFLDKVKIFFTEFKKILKYIDILTDERIKYIRKNSKNEYIIGKPWIKLPKPYKKVITYKDKDKIIKKETWIKFYRLSLDKKGDIIIDEK